MSKTILYSQIVDTSNGRQLGETNEAEYGSEWDDVAAYVTNAMEGENWELVKGIPGDIIQGNTTIDGEDFHTLYVDGIAREVWFMA